MNLNKILLALKNKLFNHPISLDEYIRLRLKQGTPLKEIKDELLKDLAEGGPIFKDFRKEYKATFPNSIKRFNDSEYPTKYIWTSVHSPKHPSCADCLERDGQLKTWEEWQEIGLPRTGKTRCKKDCKCVLLPK